MKEVKRHAKVGEYIKIVDCNDVVGYGYKNGDIFKIVKTDSLGTVNGVSEIYNDEDDDWCFYDEEYVVLEDYNPDEAKQTKIVVDKINTEELVVPKPNIEIIKDIVSNIQNALSFDFKLNIGEEREEKDMNKVLKLYEERKLKEIDEKYEKKVGDDYNEIELVKQYNELVMNFESKLEELSNSLDNFDNGYLVTQCDSNCYKYVLYEDRIKNELRSKYVDEQMKEVNDVKKLVSEVDAQLSLSDDLTYQLEVLNRYGIIDKKTNKMTV